MNKLLEVQKLDKKRKQAAKATLLEAQDVLVTENKSKAQYLLYNMVLQTAFYHILSCSR